MSSKLFYLLLFPIAFMYWLIYSNQFLFKFGNRKLIIHKIAESFQSLVGKRNMKLQKSPSIVEEVHIIKNNNTNGYIRQMPILNNRIRQNMGFEKYCIFAALYYKPESFINEKYSEAFRTATKVLNRSHLYLFITPEREMWTLPKLEHPHVSEENRKKFHFVNAQNYSAGRKISECIGNSRFFWYYNFLLENQDHCDYVALIDFDVKFQYDLFLLDEFSIPFPYLSFSGLERKLGFWDIIPEILKRCFGVQELKQILNYEEHCSCITVGNRSTILLYLKMLTFSMLKMNHCECQTLLDQLINSIFADIDPIEITNIPQLSFLYDDLLVLSKVRFKYHPAESPVYTQYGPPKYLNTGEDGLFYPFWRMNKPVPIMHGGP